MIARKAQGSCVIRQALLALCLTGACACQPVVVDLLDAGYAAPGVDGSVADATGDSALSSDRALGDAHAAADSAAIADRAAGDGPSSDSGGTSVPVRHSFDCWSHAIGSFDTATRRFVLERNDHSGDGPLAVTFGPASAGLIPLAGDWDGDGADTVAVFDPAPSRFYLDLDNSGGAADVTVDFGTDNAGWLPMSGDWDSDGLDTIGLYAPAAGRFYLDNDNSGGIADVTFDFGTINGQPVAGDWDGDGTDTVGVYQAGVFKLAAENRNGTAFEVVNLGVSGTALLPLAGDWDGDGDDEPGLYDPAAALFHLDHPGGVVAIRWPVAGVPVTGDWMGDAQCITWEAEAATTISPPMQAAASTTASGRAYIHVPNGAGQNGSAVYDFTVAAAGSFVIWGRAAGATGNDDSFYVSVDGGTEHYWSFGQGASWRWDRVNDLNGPLDPVVFDLARGDHQLRIRQREDGAALDAILVTTAGSYVAGVRQVTRVGDAWTGTQVGFDFVQHQDLQTIAYYDDTPNRVVAYRTSDAPLWQAKTLGPFADRWDSHNYLTTAWDRDDQLHLSGDMHGTELIYYRSQTPLAVDTLTDAAPMLASGLEQYTTYPRFFEGPASELLFMYRAGASGDGVWYLNKYDLATRTWSRYIDQPLFGSLSRAHLFLDDRPLTAQGCTYVAGDWSNRGQSVVGTYCPVTGTFHLPASNQVGAASTGVRYGPVNSDWLPIMGDWDGDGSETFGLYALGSATFYLRNSVTAGAADLTFVFSDATGTLTPIAGDWDGDGTDGIGLYDAESSRFYLRNTLSTGRAELSFVFGSTLACHQPLAGDWNGDGVDTVGLYRPENSGVYLRNAHAGGAADVSFLFGPGNRPVVAVSGDWANIGRDTVGFGESPYVWLLEGLPASTMNAYFEGPVRDPTGRYHMIWVWRRTSDAASNSDISYASSDNLRDWTDSLGNPLTLPITLATNEVVDPVPVGRGVLNGLVRLGFDTQGRVVVSYHKYDSYLSSDLGSSQIYNTRREASGWQSYQATNWNCRWDFGGGGTLNVAVGVGAVAVDGGRATQAFSINVDTCIQSGVWVLDEDTLTPLTAQTFWRGSMIPDVLTSPTLLDPGLPAGVWNTYFAPGVRVSFASARGDPTPGTTRVLRWETIGTNRDLPRYCDTGQRVVCQPGQLPASRLVVYDFETFGP